jgi:hypothetical protein
LFPLLPLYLHSACLLNSSKCAIDLTEIKICVERLKLSMRWNA